ncbi:hypothetical protein MTO96_027757 [Rhipicephalus appendiculatus]
MVIPLYKRTSYDFLINKGPGHQLLFTVDLNWANTALSRRVLRSRQFGDSLDDARSVLQRQRIYGLGILKHLPYVVTWHIRKPFLEMTYHDFNRVMIRIGVDWDLTKNFFAFQPDDTFTPSVYHDYLTLLNSIDGLSIVIIRTITDEDMLQVMPSSSWDRSCLPQLNQPVMEDAVSAILSIPNPKVNYTLTMSLRLDKFNYVTLLSLLRPTLGRIPVPSRESFFFQPRCRTELFTRDPNGTTIAYIQGDNCAFAAGESPSDAVVTFETPRTVQYKMRDTYRTIGYAKTDTHVVGWMVYNVTCSLASTECLGHHSRITEIRKIIDENKAI